MDTARAKLLRQNPTVAERRMWRLLFPMRTNGFHFRKQAPIGPCTVDFACHHAKIVIEVDGDTHGTSFGIASDARRDAFLNAEGYNVLRFTNRDVLQNPEGVPMIFVHALAGHEKHRPITAAPTDL